MDIKNFEQALGDGIKLTAVSSNEWKVEASATFLDGKPLDIRLINAGDKWYYTDKKQTLRYMNDLYDKGKKYYEIGKYHKAIKIMKKVSKKGNADAPAILGFIYIFKKKYKKAVYWLTIASERGNSEAQYELACLYEEGYSIPWNPEKAFYWFMELAKADDRRGMFEVGMLYAKGEGVEKNSEKALYWVEKSAEHGDDFAQFMLGRMYLHELSDPCVEKDLQKGIYWLEKSANGGNEDAIKFLEKYKSSNL